MKPKCILCGHRIYPSEGAVRSESGWMAHMLCVFRKNRESKPA